MCFEVVIIRPFVRHTSFTIIYFKCWHSKCFSLWDCVACNYVFPGKLRLYLGIYFWRRKNSVEYLSVANFAQPIMQSFNKNSQKNSSSCLLCWTSFVKKSSSPISQFRFFFFSKAEGLTSQTLYSHFVSRCVFDVKGLRNFDEMGSRLFASEAWNFFRLPS